MDNMEYNDIDLDEHLDADFLEVEEAEEDPIMGDLTEEEKELLKKIQKKQMDQDYILQTFKELENRPSDDQIEEFKQQVGDVYLLSLSESENFVFRPLRRLEWRTLMQRIAKLDDMKKAEAVVMKGCLWPKLDQQNINVLTAGAIETMRDMILQVSNFMPPETALQLVRKL